MKTRVLAALAALGLASCTAQNNASMQIFAICSPTDTCTFGGTCDLQYLGRPALDVGQTNSLFLFLQVNNQLQNNAAPDTGAANTHDAYVQEIKVTYAGASLPGSSARVQQTVPAGGSAVIGALAIPPAVGDAIATALPGGGEVVAKVKLTGIYGDQSSFETAEYDVPVLVCSGCVAAPTCPASDPTLPPVPATTMCPPNPGQLPLTASCGG